MTIALVCMKMKLGKLWSANDCTEDELREADNKQKDL